MQKRKIKKALLISLGSLIVLVVLVIVFISPIAKFLIEKYDVKYLGREIKIGWLYLNPFTGYISIHNLKVFEANSDSVFLTAAAFNADFEMLKALTKTYEVSNISLNQPVAYIIQKGKTLNFSDLIARFTTKEKRDTTQMKEPVHFNILNIEVNNSEFHYIEQTIPINYFIKKVNIESSGKRWDTDSIDVKFSLESGPGSGEIKGHSTVNLENLRYSATASIKHFDLSLFDQYLQDLANYGHLAATIDVDIKASGSLVDQLDLDASGLIAINNFHFGEKIGKDFAAFDRMVIDIIKVNPKNYKYQFDSMMIARLFCVYERYDELNNIERMFGKGGSRIKQGNAESEAGKFNLIIEIAKYVKVVGKNFLKSNYKIGKVAIYDGMVKFNDFALREKFSITASPLYIIADSIDKDHKRFKVALTTGIKPYGSIAVNLSLDPSNFGNFDLHYKLLKLPVTMFNPYLVSYTSFPLDRGKLELTGYMNVADSNIRSENHLLIMDPSVAKRVNKKDTRWIPVPFIMSLVRSSGNAIDFQIPIAGDLNDPKFRIWPIIGEVVRNILVKPVSSGYLYHVKQVEQEIDKSQSLTWEMRQTELRPLQEKFVNRMAAYLKDNEEASITISPVHYAEKEKEYILLFEAKQKYFLQSGNLTGKVLSEEDSIFVDNMSVKDSLFIHYLDKVTAQSRMFTLQEKCNSIIKKEIVQKRFLELVDKREKSFKDSFGALASRVKFGKEVSMVPFNGFSYYKIDYPGEIPKSLTKAYQQMGELNEKAPRKKYIKKRPSG